MENKSHYALISGASSGFGRETARTFAAQGWNLILTARRAERLHELRDEINAQFPACDIILCAFDIRHADETQQAIAAIDENIKKQIRVLINNAGLALGRAPFDAAEMSDWEQMIDTNVKGLLYLSRLIIPYFIENKAGHIINISSIAGKEVYPSGNIYCASKHAVDAISQAMRMDLLPHGIKVSNIAPGAANTEFSLVRFKGDQSVADKVYDGFDPLVAKDIADTIWFIVSRPAHVNIADITILPAAQATGTIFHKS